MQGLDEREQKMTSNAVTDRTVTLPELEALADKLFAVLSGVGVLSELLDQMVIEGKAALEQNFPREGLPLVPLQHWRAVFQMWEASIPLPPPNQHISAEEMAPTGAGVLQVAKSLLSDARFVEELDFTWSLIWRETAEAVYQQLLADASEVCRLSAGNSFMAARGAMSVIRPA